MTDQELRDAIRAADEKEHVAYVRHLCEQYLQRHPDHAPTLVRYAKTLYMLAQYAAANAALDRAEATAPTNRLSHVMANRGHLLVQQGDFAAAEEVYLQAHRLDPDDATYLIYAGDAAFRRGAIERATRYDTLATHCKEGCIEEAYFNLGGLLLAEKRYAEAAESYRKALEIDPEYELARLRLEDVELVMKAEAVSA